jgi:hypothetical protein
MEAAGAIVQPIPCRPFVAMRIGCDTMGDLTHKFLPSIGEGSVVATNWSAPAPETAWRFARAWQ